MDAELLPYFRLAVRGHLVDRPAAAQPATIIHTHVSRQFTCDVPDVQNALIFLTSLGHLKEIPNPMGGSARSYQATAAGIIAHERGE